MDLCISIFNKFSHKEYGKIMLVGPLKKAKVLFSDTYSLDRTISKIVTGILILDMSRSFISRW
jgi:hypothetical protein